jgi:probable phosphoglycerate mutase
VTDPTTILVARHADAEYETRHWADEGGSLTRRGRDQARGLARRLVGRRVTHIYTSTYARAVQTGEIAAARLDVGVTTREGLKEFSVGSLAGSRAEDPFAGTYAAWLAGDLDRRLPGGETGAELRHRMHHVLHEIVEVHPGETVLAMSHGGLMRLTLP